MLYLQGCVFIMELVDFAVLACIAGCKLQKSQGLWDSPAGRPEAI